MDRKDWNRIGLVAAIFLVPGGFILGGALAARRAGKAISDGSNEPNDLPDKAEAVPNAVAGPEADAPDNSSL